MFMIPPRAMFDHLICFFWPGTAGSEEIAIVYAFTRERQTINKQSLASALIRTSVKGLSSSRRGSDYEVKKVGRCGRKVESNEQSVE
jgi:hypothetical protein